MPSRNAAAAGRAANAPCAQTRLAPHLRRRPRARAAPSYACSSAFPFPLSIHLTSLACQCKLTFYPVQRVSPGGSGSSLAADAAAVFAAITGRCHILASRDVHYYVLGRGLSRKNILLENKDQEFTWCVCNKPLRSKIPARDRIVHVRRTQETMPTGKSVSAFQKLCTPA